MSFFRIATGLGLVLVLLSLAGIAVLFWFGLRRPAVRRPSCGSCGYAVEGLEALSCPECGSDLRKVGIETPRRRMIHPGLFVLLWTLLLIAPLGAGYTMALRLGPKRTIVDAAFGLRASNSSMPALQLDVRMNAAGFGRGVSVSSSDTSEITHDDTTSTTFVFPSVSFSVNDMTVDVRTVVDAVQSRPARLTLNSRDHAPGAIDRSTLAPVFDDSRDVVSRTNAADDEAAVIALLDALLGGDTEFTTNRLQTAGNTTVFARSIVAPWYAPTLIAIGAAIYALGILIYFMLRKRRLTDAAS